MSRHSSSASAADAPPPTPATPSTKHSIAAAARTDAFNSRKTYEQQRRAHLQSQFDSSNLYWSAARNLLNDAVLETDRAKEIVEARIHVDRLYAEQMEALHRGDVCDQNKPITAVDTKTRAKKKKHHRHREGNPVGSNGGLLKMGKDGLLESRVSSDVGILAGIINSHNDIAARYNENVAAMTNEILPDLTDLCKTLTVEVTKLETLGNSLVFEIEAAENKVQQRYLEYEDAASKALNGGAGGTPVVSADNTLVENSYCVWLAEMKYVLAVVLLQKSFRQCNDGLGEVFKQMKELEFTRRIRLRDLMLAFMQRQEQLWVALPAMSAPTMQRLRDTPIDRETVDAEIGKAIRAEATNIQMSDATKGLKRQMSISEGGPLKVNDSLDQRKASDAPAPAAPAAEGLAPPPTVELESPLTSDFLGKVKVIEKKKDGMMGGWRSCLAIITADNYLHLFDIPSALKIQPDSAPEVAFQQLIPAVVIPPLDLAKGMSGKAPEKWQDVAREWHQGLTPTESIALPNCEIKFAPKVNDQAFEVVETTFNTGASKMFSKTSSRKFTLKAANQEDAVDWIVSLQSQR
jgi:hypothetical protein